MADSKTRDITGLAAGAALALAAYVGYIKGKNDGVKQVSEVAETISEVSAIMAEKDEKK